jgi:hypothetical protein
MSASCPQGTAGASIAPSEEGGGNPRRVRRKGGGRPITYRRIMNKTIKKLLNDPNSAPSYSSMISFNKWAFKAHLIKGDSVLL